MEILIYSYCAIALLTAIMETRAFIENQREKNKPVLSRDDLKFYGVSDDEIDDFTKIENEEKTEREEVREKRDEKRRFNSDLNR